jgi:DNA ligase 1
MKFQKLAEYFEELEKTSSRLALIDILSKLFAELSAEEVPMVTYLIQGRVAPFYEPVEIGMAEKGVAAAIARAYGVEREEVLKTYGKLGDLGKVAEQLSAISRQSSANHSMSIKEVFEGLTKIAQFSGDGTVENKVAALTNLLSKVSGVGAKHLVRIPLGTSRLGIGDPTVLDAFAQAKLGDRSKRKLLEEAYNKVSDLGLIGEVLWSKGLKGVEGLNVTVGRPLRSQLAERINDTKTILEKFGGEAHVQQKFDGFRVQIHKNGNEVRTFSRNLEETTPMLPDIVAGVLKQVKAKTAIFDSEALAYNPESEEFLPFQETTKRRRKHGIEAAAEKTPMKAFVFDVIYYDGKSLVDMPLRDRLKILTSGIKGDEVLIPQPGEFVTDYKRIELLFNEALTKGLEGLIVKRPDSLYEAGARNFNWIKMKKNSVGELKDTIDCVILGYIFGRGKRAQFGAGALLVGVYDKEKDEYVTVAKIGTGLTDDEWREIHKRADKISLDKQPARVNSIIQPSVWVKPEIVVEILADEITKSPIHTAGRTGDRVQGTVDSGYALRFPRLLRFRESDKRSEDATTVKELIEMYNLQYKKN